MAAAPCKECGRRPKAPGRHRCSTCQLRREPIGEQVAAARRRLAMVPLELRVKRTPKVMRHAPEGTAWCAGCQSWRDLEDFGKKATQCRACSSAAQHGAMVAKTYGLTAEQYDTLLERQGGRCAICRARPKSKRLAVDHDHKTGAVRGLLCSRCNHDLLGSAWDSLAMASALWHYMNTPPASGQWLPPEVAPALIVDPSAERPADASKAGMELVTTHGGKASERATKGGKRPTSVEECTRPHYLPSGSESVPGKHGVWRIWVEPGGDPPF